MLEPLVETKELVGNSLFLYTYGINTEQCLKNTVLRLPAYPPYIKSTPLCSHTFPFLCQVCLSPSKAGFFLTEPAEMLPNRVFHPEGSAIFCSIGQLIISHLRNGPRHTYIKFATLSPRYKHYPEQTRTTSEDDWPEGRCSQNTGAECMHCTPETHPKVSGPGQYMASS